MSVKYVAIAQTPSYQESCGQVSIKLEIDLTLVSNLTSPLAPIFKINNFFPAETSPDLWTVIITDRFDVESIDNMILIKPLDQFVPGSTISYTLEATLSSLPSGFDGNLCNKVEFVYGTEVDTNITCLANSTDYDHETSLVISQENIWGNQASVDMTLLKLPGNSKKPAQYTGQLVYSDPRWGDTSVSFSKMSQVNVSDHDLTFTTNKIKSRDQASFNLMLTPLSPGTKQLILISASDQCQIKQKLVKEFLVKLPVGSAELKSVFPIGNDDLVVYQGSAFEQIYLFYNRSGYDYQEIEVVIDFSYDQANMSAVYYSDPDWKNPSAGTVSYTRTGSDLNVVNRIIWKIPFVRSLSYHSLRIYSGAINHLGLYQMTAKASGEFIFDSEAPLLNVSVQPDPWGTA